MNDYEQQLNEAEEKILAQQKEIEALLGVIDGMKLIIKKLEDERNRQNNNTN